MFSEVEKNWNLPIRIPLFWQTVLPVHHHHYINIAVCSKTTNGKQVKEDETHK